MTDAVKEAVVTCINLECYDCLHNHPFTTFPRDNNIYHLNGNPCRAYRIRRHYGLDQPEERQQEQ